MMSSQLRYLDVDIKEVKVGYKPHKKSKQKDCYNNAYRELTDHLSPDSRYVLGYLMHASGDQHIPIEHAFVFDGNSYWDVTLDPRPEDEYISLVELTMGEVMDFVNENGHAPDLYAMNRFNGTKKGN